MEDFKVFEEAECQICQDNKSTILFIPCRHLSTCEECCKKLDRCHICRSEIKARLKRRNLVINQTLHECKRCGVSHRIYCEPCGHPSLCILCFDLLSNHVYKHSVKYPECPECKYQVVTVYEKTQGGGKNYGILNRYYINHRYPTVRSRKECRCIVS